MAWTGEDKSPDYLFHYTEADYAEEIAATGHFEVGPGAHFGFGLYATDLAPEEATPEEIRAVCFEGDAPSNRLDGALVLKQGLDLPFVEVDRRVYLFPAEAGELIPIEEALVAVVFRYGAGWDVSRWE